MSEGLWSLVGVVVGFGLAELTQWLKTLRNDQALRGGLKAELETIVRMIPHKVSIIVQAEGALQSARVMNTTSTHFPRQVYDRIIESAPHLLSAAERDCLHVLYERLRINDTVMDSLEERFNSMTTAHSIGAAVQATAGALGDLKTALTATADIASSFVNGRAIDVFPKTDA
jgi:hypothetical protein